MFTAIAAGAEGVGSVVGEAVETTAGFGQLRGARMQAGAHERGRGRDDRRGDVLLAKGQAGPAAEAVPAKPPAKTSPDADISDISLLFNMISPSIFVVAHSRRLSKRPGPFTGRMLPLV